MSDRHVWRSRIAGVAAATLLAANLTSVAEAAAPVLKAPSAPGSEAPIVRVSKTGDKVAAGVAGAVVGGLIGAAIANSDKNRAPGYYPPQPAPGYYPPPAPPPPQYGSDAAWRTCVAYGNKYSQKSGALGLRLDNIVSIQPRGYNTFVVSAYMSVLWPNYQARSYVTCTVTNGTVTSWLVA